MTEVEELHRQNLMRFEAIETRLTTIETTLKNGLSIIKWLGTVVTGVLLLLLATTVMKP